jgi:membrane-bound inhibitor of C-type lysozyme
MKKYIAILIIIALALTVWIWRQKAEVIQTGSAVYACDSGRTISAIFYEGPAPETPAPGEPPVPTGSVEISLNGEASTTLPQTISGSGVRFANADESFVFWNKGNSAIIMRNNSMDPDYTNCSDVSATNTYTSGKYGFSFDIAGGYTYKEYTDEIISIGTPVGEDGFDAVAEVHVVKSGGEGGYKSFDDFVFESSRNVCAADGPSATIYCDKVQSKEPYTSPNGLEGIAFYLNRVHEDLSTKEKAESAFGPLFSFNITANTPDSKFSALVVRPPANLTAEEINSEMVRKIADSVRIDKVPRQ